MSATPEAPVFEGARRGYDRASVDAEAPVQERQAFER